jgi:endonuclease III
MDLAMATTMNKQRLVSQIFADLASSLAPPTGDQADGVRSVLEEFVYAILREGHTRDDADRAFASLKKSFYDWNEIRVSMPEELVAAIEPWISEPTQRSQRIIDLLQEVFESTFSFELDGLDKKGLKQAGKVLQRYTASSAYAVAWVTQKSLGGHMLPLDDAAVRCLRRLKMIEDTETDVEAIRESLEAQIPKTKGALFVDLISQVTKEHCWEESPDCPKCPLKATCPTGQTAKASTRPANKKPR